MALILMVLAFAAIYLLISTYIGEDRENEWGTSMVWSAVLWGTLIVIITEGLSSVHAVNQMGVLIAWSIATVILVAVVALKTKRRWEPKLSIKEILKTDMADKIILMGAGLILSSTLILGLVLPPTLGDVIYYHLPRIMQWEQAASVAFFPTHDLRQILFNPWAEYAVMNVHLLSGSDHTLALLQWFAALGCILASVLITRELSNEKGSQMLTLAFAVSVPLGIFQAQTPKNDLVLAFWFLCFIWFMMRMIKVSSCAWHECAGAALALGLANLTKSYAVVLAFPFLLWATLRIVKARRRDVLKLFAFIIVAGLALNGPHYLRKASMTGSLSGLVIEGQIWSAGLNVSHDPRVAVSNVVWSVAQGCSVPVESVNDAILNCAERINALLGIAANDSQTIWIPSEKKMTKNPVFGNLIVIMIFIASTIFYAVHRKRGFPLVFAICLIMSFYMFCCLFKWHTSYWRQLLPLSFAACSFSGVALLECYGKKVATVVALIALAYGISMFPFIVYTDIGKDELRKGGFLHDLLREDLVMNNRNIQADYERTVEFIAKEGYSHIGLFVCPGGGGNEYAVWRLMARRPGQETQLQHVLVENVSNVLAKRYPYSDFHAQCILIIGPTKEKRDRILTKIAGSTILFETESTSVVKGYKM